MPNNFLEAALVYARNGWSVIPVQPKGKVPLVPWQAFTSQRATEEQINAWWSETPDANVGLVTGVVSGLVAVDIDPDRGGQARPIYGEAPTSLIAKTGGGGYHLFYKHPGGRVGNQVTPEGIDVRGDGGFVVVAPSVHSSGSSYEWVRSGSAGATLPRTLFAPPDDESTHGDPGEGNWITMALRGVGDGNRNNTCAKLAGYFEKQRLPLDIANQLAQNWNLRNSPPKPRDEIDRTVRSVYETARRKRGPDNGGAFDLVPWGTYLGSYSGQEVDWTIEDWLPSRTICFMISPPEGYKTWLTLDLAISVASGLPFLGTAPVQETGPVILIQQEDYHGQTTERLQVIANARYGLGGLPSLNGDGIINAPMMPSNLPIHFHTNRAFRFDDKEIVEQFSDSVRKIKPRLVIIDPLYYAAGKIEDYMAPVVEHMSVLKGLRDELGTTFVICHHTSKKQAETSRESAWGSQFLNAFMETGWQLRHTGEEGKMVIRRHFKRYVGIGDRELRFAIKTTGDLEYAVAVTAMDSAVAEDTSEDREYQTRVCKVLDKRPMQFEELVSAVGIDKTLLARAIMQLEDANVIDRRPDSRYVLVASLNLF